MALTSTRAAGLILAGLACGCSDALLQPQQQDEQGLDDRLAIRGRVCTALPDATLFPVKVMFLIDKSGSMCVLDPPGSQATAGFCQTYGTAPPGVTQPGRVRALKELMRQFLPLKNVLVSLVPWETSVRGDFPSTPPWFVAGSRIAQPDPTNATQVISPRIDALQNDLGKGTDCQGAFATAYARIEQDVLDTPPPLRARTRYVVVLLTDGVPFPWCAANDNLPVYATPKNPFGIWPDSPGAGCPGTGCYCNATQPTNCPCDPATGTDCQGNTCIPGFVGGTDRNQDYQILDTVDRLVELKRKYNLGDLRVHTLLLFNLGAAIQCGAICARDLFNGLQPDDAHAVAEYFLRQIAEVHGGGTYQEFYDAASISFAQLDYTSLASRFVMKTLLAENVNALPVEDGVAVDSDGDGLADDLDNTFTAGTSRFIPDSDADGYSDGFEYLRRARGFVAGNDPDPRGCRPIAGQPPPLYSCADTDGDGLSETAERYLGAMPTVVDSDADGLPDGVEVKAGLDPTSRNDNLADWDADAVPDLAEVLGHTAPLFRDPAGRGRDAYRYEVTAVPQQDGSVCYDFLTSNVRLLTPDTATSAQKGFNLVTLVFGEAPESNVARDYGAWKAACVWAQFAAPSVRVPLDPEFPVQLRNADFVPLDVFGRANLRTLCKGVPP